MADATGLGPVVRKGVGVQIPPSAQESFLRGGTMGAATDIMPTFRYRDCAAAITWLADVLGCGSYRPSA